jgi:hypothetical protein
VNIPPANQGTADYARLFPRERQAIVRPNYKEEDITRAMGDVSDRGRTIRSDVTLVAPEPEKAVLRDFNDQRRHVLLGLLDVGSRATVKQLLELLDYEEDDVRPTSYAFSAVWNLLLTAVGHLPGGLPSAVVYTDEEGGIRCEWRHAPRQLRLIVPAESHGRHYIYHEEGDNYCAEEPVSPEMLAVWLRWLTEREPVGA